MKTIGLLGGMSLESTELYYRAIIEQLRADGAEAVVEGCTEIVMLVQQRHTQVPLFDTTAIHAEAAVAWALQ